MTEVRQVPLTQGYVALVDNDDYENVARFRWHIRKSKSNTYARRICVVAGRHVVIVMANQIMSPGPGMVVDHVNGETLDNRRANLRLASYSQNNSYRVCKLGASGLRGVYPSGKRWIARIRWDNKTYYLGTFSTPEEAAIAHDFAAREFHGEFAVVNYQKP